MVRHLANVHSVTGPAGVIYRMAFLSFGGTCRANQYSTCSLDRVYTHKNLIVSPDESRGYLGFSTVTPPPQRFPFGRDNLKNISVRTFKFGMWVYTGNAPNALVL